jgi:hypothetical protein
MFATYFLILLLVILLFNVAFIRRKQETLSVYECLVRLYHFGRVDVNLPPRVSVLEVRYA